MHFTNAKGILTGNGKYKRESLVNKVKLLHQIMAEATGGSAGIRDEGLLDAALESTFATFDGVEP